jgi:hypothetical protein
MDSKNMKEQEPLFIQRKIAVFANRKAEEYYQSAQWLAGQAIEQELSKTQVAGMLMTINTTSSSTEFLNYLKKQVGKAQNQKIKSGKHLRADSTWLKLISVDQDSKEMKAFGVVFVERLEKVRQEAISDANNNKLEPDDKIKLCLLYLRQFLKAFEAHYLYSAIMSSDIAEKEPLEGMEQ